VKSGIIRGVSVGFDPKEMEPLDPKRPRGGQRFTKCELLEISFVSVPADAGAGVTARHAPRTAAQLAMLTALPATPAAALTRAAERFKSGRSDGKLIPHATQVSMLLHAKAEREKGDFVARQRQLEALRARGRRQGN
jgi:hypothetical protein